MNPSSPFSRDDEIRFWGQQILEHQIFIYNGLVEDAITDADIEPRFIDGKPYSLRDEALIHLRQWDIILNKPRFDNQEVNEAILSAFGYQNYILNILDRGIFIGYLYPSLIKHMNMETDYLWKKLNGYGYNFNDEFSFWVVHHQGETAVAEKLLDPSENQLAKIIQHYDEELEQLKNRPEETVEEFARILSGYDNIGSKIKDGLERNTLKSIISPLLIEHAIREGERAKQIFEWFLSRQF